MARRTLADNVKLGVLSINNAAALSGIAATRIRELVDKKLVSHYLLPGTKTEVRLSAASLLEYVKQLHEQNNFPISHQLIEAAKNFDKFFTPEFARKSASEILSSSQSPATTQETSTPEKS